MARRTCCYLLLLSFPTTQPLVAGSKPWRSSRVTGESKWPFDVQSASRLHAVLWTTSFACITSDAVSEVVLLT
jgi:hypothetical protein